MIAKIIAALLILSGSLLCGALWYEQRGYFWLLLAGEQTDGQIVDISPSGMQALSHSRFNLSSPSNIEAYEVSVLFKTEKGEYRATTRLDYYQINLLLDNRFTLDTLFNHAAFSGQPLPVIYLAHNPVHNQIDVAPGWNAYWYPMTGGVVFLGMGIALWRASYRGNRPSC